MYIPKVDDQLNKRERSSNFIICSSSFDLLSKAVFAICVFLSCSFIIFSSTVSCTANAFNMSEGGRGGYFKNTREERGWYHTFTTNRITSTFFVCPSLCTRSIAWSSTAENTKDISKIYEKRKEKRRKRKRMEMAHTWIPPRIHLKKKNKID